MPSERRRRASLVRGALAVLVGATVLSPVASSAQEDDPNQRREEVRERRAQLDTEIDVLEASAADIERAMSELETNVGLQQDELAEAERAWRAAEEDVAEAEEAVVQAEQRIVELEEATDTLVAEAFMNPPSADAFDAFNAETMSDAAVTSALLSLQADADADLLDQLGAAQEDLEIERANKEDAAAAAEERKNASGAELADLEDALTEQQAFATEVEGRIERALAEAESLKETDEELSRQIAAEQAEAARRLREMQEAQAAVEAATGAEPAPPPPPANAGITEAPGGLSTVSCPTGGQITIASSIAQNVQAMLNLAGQQGVPLCGSGYRDPQRQIELRRQHCGTSDYAVYQMPSSQCSPPTARPGSSRHEVGLAIDFTCAGGSIDYGGSCDSFLKSSANNYGLYNLPSEIWHYSDNGN